MGKFTHQKLEKLETRKLENDFRVCEVHKTRKLKKKNRNFLKFVKFTVNFTKLHELEILNIIIIKKNKHMQLRLQSIKR